MNKEPMSETGFSRSTWMYSLHVLWWFLNFSGLCYDTWLVRCYTKDVSIYSHRCSPPSPFYRPCWGAGGGGEGSRVHKLQGAQTAQLRIRHSPLQFRIRDKFFPNPGPNPTYFFGELRVKYFNSSSKGSALFLYFFKKYNNFKFCEFFC